MSPLVVPIVPYIWWLIYTIYILYSFARVFSIRDETSGASEDAEPAAAEPDATEEAGAEPTSP
jgi:hypothetical protein